MKLRTLSTLFLTGTLLSSCIYYTTPVPEMPYRPYKQNPAAASAYNAAAQAGNTWYTTPPAATTPLPSATGYTEAAIPPPVASPQPALAPAATPVPAPAPVKPSSVITQPSLKLNPVTPKLATEPKPATPAVKPATPAPKEAAPAMPKDPKSITNTGPIPVATPVPGDPTRVYNPLDSSKTIRITDKNGKIYPSGKELKVRGTNFHFYVP